MDFEAIWQAVQDFLLWLWSQWQTQSLVYLIGGNFVVAVAVGLSTGEFRLGKLAEVLYKKVLPQILVYAFFAFAGEALDLGWVATGAWGLLTATLLGDLLDSLGKLGIFKDDSPVAISPMLKK